MKAKFSGDKVISMNSTPVSDCIANQASRQAWLKMMTPNISHSRASRSAFSNLIPSAILKFNSHNAVGHSKKEIWGLHPWKKFHQRRLVLGIMETVRGMFTGSLYAYVGELLGPFISLSKSLQERHSICS